MKSACTAPTIIYKHVSQEAISIMATAIIRASKNQHRKDQETALPLDLTQDRSVHGTPKDNTEIKL
jgi:hypothetical protein